MPSLKENVQQLLGAAKNVQKKQDKAAYLSLPLLASAKLGDRALYDECQREMNALLEDNQLWQTGDDLAIKAWILGRALLAALNIGDNEFIIKAHQKSNLLSLLQRKEIAKNAFSVCGWALLAHVDNSAQYIALDKDSIKAAINIAEELTKKLASAKTEADRAEALSNTLWSWVMIFQVAAKNKDIEFSKLCVERMKEITGQPTIAQALEAGLPKPEDCPAWVIAIAVVSVDELLSGLPQEGQKVALPHLEADLFELQNKLTNTLERAKASGNLADTTLAKLTVSYNFAKNKPQGWPEYQTAICHFNQAKVHINAEQYNKIKKQAQTLEKEINSIWPYPNKSRKQEKRNALTELLMESIANYDSYDSLANVVDKIEKTHEAVRLGNLSHRTSELLDELRGSTAPQLN